jgi:hypothetical protein
MTRISANTSNKFSLQKPIVRGSEAVGRAPRGHSWSSEGAGTRCKKRVKGKICILIGTLLGWNILFITLVPVLAPKYKQHFCRRLKLEKYIIHWLNFKSNVFIIWIYSGWGETFMNYFCKLFNFSLNNRSKICGLFFPELLVYILIFAFSYTGVINQKIIFGGQ